MLGCLMALALAGCGQAPASVTVDRGRAAVGSAAPDFRATTLDGKSLSLHGLRGKPVILNFWATWCAECRSEMPAIQATWVRHRAAGLQVVGVNFREGDVPRERRFLDQAGASYPSLSDPDGKIADAYRVTNGLPVSIFIDRAGIVTYIQTGPMSADFIEARLAGILN